MKRLAIVVLGIAVCVGWAIPAWAQDSNENSFSIAPPPLSYPDYSLPGTMQQKVTGTYVNITVDQFDLTGIGGAYSGRRVLDRTGEDLGQGIGLNAGVYHLSGSGAGLSLTGIVQSVGGNYEREVAHNDTLSAVVFVGPALSFAYLSGSSSSFDLDVTTFLFGGQLGGQVTFTTGDIRISPWAMYSAMSGTTSATVYGAFGTTSTDSDVSISTTTFGFDVLHARTSITLSGMLQNSGGDSNAKVTILSLSYTFGGRPAGATEGLKTQSAQTGAPGARAIALR